MSRVMRRPLSIVAALLSTAIAAPAAAQVVIDFDFDPFGTPILPNTAITDQYADIGVNFEGIENSSPVAIHAGNDPDGNAEPSGGNVMTNCSDAASACPGNRADIVRITFDGDASDISLQLNTLGSSSVTFQLYDVGGNLLEEQTLTSFGSVYVPVTFTAEGVRRIDGLQPSDGWAWAFDDLTFIMVNGPTTDEEIAQLAAAAGVTGKIIVLDTRELTRMRGRDSLATRSASVSVDIPVTQSANSFGSMAGNIYTWAEITGYKAEDEEGDRSYEGRGILLGGDYALSPDMVVGFSLGVQDIEAVAGTVSQEGRLRFIQPYLAYRAGDWSGEASLILGQGEYDQTSDGGDGAGETKLAAFSFTGGYDMVISNDTTLMPTVGLLLGKEETEGVSGTLDGTGPVEVTFSEISLGAEVRRVMGSTEIFAGLHADHLETSSDTVLVSDLLVDDGWSGRVALGVSTAFDNGFELETSVEVSGIGGDLRETSGALRLAYRF